MPPYPAPQAIKTKRRCKFSLPKMRYDCRCMGRFVLDGVGYCAAHYDIAWRVANPEHGQQHEWCFKEWARWEMCRRCGSIRPYDGLPFVPCNGHASILNISRSSHPSALL